MVQKIAMVVSSYGSNDHRLVNSTKYKFIIPVILIKLIINYLKYFFSNFFIKKLAIN